jgi:hypothetical protein
MSSKKEDRNKNDIKVFVSYAMEDRGQAAALVDQLATNFQVFSASKMSAGENWQSKIKKELSKSDYFLVLLSPISVRSKWVQFELGAAWGLNKFIIPVVTSKDVINQIPLEFTNLRVLLLQDLKSNPRSINDLIESYEKSAA